MAENEITTIGVEKFTKIRSQVDTLVTDFEKFYDKGQRAAGKRLRSGITSLMKALKAEKAESLQVSRERKAQKV